MKGIDYFGPAAREVAAVLLLCASSGAGAQQLHLMPAPLAAPAATRPSIAMPARAAPAVGVRAPAPMPPMLSAHAPDLYIEEAILSYPELNAEFHLVFPNRPGRQAAPLLLQQSGTVPVARRRTRDVSRPPFPVQSCGQPLAARLRVIVGNKGQSAYDGMPPRAGVAASVGGTRLVAGFAAISPHQPRAVDLGTLSLAPGRIAFGIVLNGGRTGGEQNFANNVARGSFEIRCASPGAPQRAGQPPANSLGGARLGGGIRAFVPAMQPPAKPAHGGGIAFANPALACGQDNTPRVISVNGRASGVQLQPGSSLTITGCRFGRSGQAALMGAGSSVPLLIDSWRDNVIHAHVDLGFGGAPDLPAVAVEVIPNAAAGFASPASYSFRAARETIDVALPPQLGVYAQIYGEPKETVSPDGRSTVVERNRTYDQFCPGVHLQETDLVDVWPVDSNFLKPGFSVAGVVYRNMTSQITTDDYNSQSVLIGKDGDARYDPSTRRVVVVFQGHSMYAKKTFGVSDSGYSVCTARYSVALLVNGPRGINPLR